MPGIRSLATPVLLVGAMAASGCQPKPDPAQQAMQIAEWRAEIADGLRFQRRIARVLAVQDQLAAALRAQPAIAAAEVLLDLPGGAGVQPTASQPGGAIEPVSLSAVLTTTAPPPPREAVVAAVRAAFVAAGLPAPAADTVYVLQDADQWAVGVLFALPVPADDVPRDLPPPPAPGADADEPPN